MKAYPEYKASCIDWLGQIPSHWLTLPMKYILAKSSAGVWGDEAKEDGNDVVCFRVADFDYPHLKLGYSKITYRSIPDNQLSGREVNFGDIVIEKSGGGDLNPVGRAVMSTYNGVATCSNFMHVISTNDKAVNSYLNYLLATIYGQGLNWRFFAQTTGIQNLNIKAYLSQPIPLPPVAEQEAIAGYLDEVCGKIYALVAEKQAQVDELRAYRTSLITETVTRGLNPDALLRPSSFDWIGEIPQHWEMIPLKYLCSEDKYAIKTGPFGTQLKGDELLDSGDVRVYSQRNVIDNSFENVKFYVSNEKAKSLESFSTKANDILITSRGTIGRAAILPADAPTGILHPCLIAVRVDQNKVVLPWLIKLLNDSALFKKHINLASNSTTIEVIYTDTLKTFVLPVPPLSEQKEIAEFLDAKTAKIDEAIGELEAQLKDLADYKQAVITEAVTGKVDVRDWKPKN